MVKELNALAKNIIVAGSQNSSISHLDLGALVAPGQRLGKGNFEGASGLEAHLAGHSITH
jgi:hypothetical protein